MLCSSTKKIYFWTLIVINLATLLIFMVMNFDPSQHLLISSEHSADVFIDNAELERTLSMRRQENNNLSKANTRMKKYAPKIGVDPRIWQKYPDKKWQGMQLPVFTCIPKGRLGNVIGEYATLYAIGRIYNVTVRLHPSMENTLKNMFPNLTMLSLPVNFKKSEWTEIENLPPANYGAYEAAASGLMGPKAFVLKGNPFLYHLFHAYRQDLLKEFTLSPALQNKVHKFWNANLKNSEAVLIGVHVRRTDYIRYIKRKEKPLPGDPYFKRATDYYRKKFPAIQFLVASDDMKFVKKHFAKFKDVLYVPGTDRELDFALLTSCNHSIITVGTFGFLTAYLTGGEVVYPDIKFKQPYSLQREDYEFSQLDFFTPMLPH